MSNCPVCQTEYIKGEVKSCSTCGWDLTHYPVTFSGQIPEVFLEKERAKLAWAKNKWRQLKHQFQQFNQEKMEFKCSLKQVTQERDRLQIQLEEYRQKQINLESKF